MTSVFSIKSKNHHFWVIREHQNLEPRITEQLFQGFSNLCLGGREIETANFERQKISTFIERKAELAVRGEKLAQPRLLEPEADVEVKHWEEEF